MQRGQRAYNRTGVSPDHNHSTVNRSRIINPAHRLSLRKRPIMKAQPNRPGPMLPKRHEINDSRDHRQYKRRVSPSGRRRIIDSPHRNRSQDHSPTHTQINHRSNSSITNARSRRQLALPHRIHRSRFTEFARAPQRQQAVGKIGRFHIGSIQDRGIRHDLLLTLTNRITRSINSPMITITNHRPPNILRPLPGSKCIRYDLTTRRTRARTR